MHVSKGIVAAAIAALTAPLPLRAVGSRLLRRLSLRTITALLIAGVVLATGGFAYVTYAGGQHRASTTRLVEREIVVEELYEDVRSAAAAEGATTAAYFIVRLPQLLADFDQVRGDAESALSGLRQVVPESDPEELGRIERLEATHDRVASRYAEVLQALGSGNEEAALAIVAEPDFVSQARSFNEELRLAADDASARLLAAQHEDVAVQTRWNRIVLAGGVAWMLFIVAVSLIQFRWVLRPIARVTTATRAMAAGDLEVRVLTAGLKELDDLSACFNIMAAQLQESTERLRHAATTDALTGLPNYRSLQDALTRELERSLRYGHSLAVLMMDIDAFKLFNDTYGHQAGDRVLRQVAEVLRKINRASDVIGRYGGDEFMAILPHTDREEAASMANRMLEVFSLERVHTEHGVDLPLALSVGLAVCPADSQHKQELLAYADASLYEAKQVSGSSLRIFRQEPGEIIAYQNTPLGVLDSLVRGIDAKDRYTRRHSQQDAELAVKLGNVLNLSEELLRALRIAGLLHDVGKIGVPDRILKKPGPLTDEERAVMEEHVVLSKLIVQGVPNLQDVAEAVHAHHERWDGNGYPQGLRGEEIPLLGRILIVADAYSAMILDRPYRKALSHEEAVAELRKYAGTQFDPTLVEPFIGTLEPYLKTAA